jgi:hypothetical protein
MLSLCERRRDVRDRSHVDPAAMGGILVSLHPTDSTMRILERLFHVKQFSRGTGGHKSAIPRS